MKRKVGIGFQDYAAFSPLEYPRKRNICIKGFPKMNADKLARETAALVGLSEKLAKVPRISFQVSATAGKHWPEPWHHNPTILLRTSRFSSTWMHVEGSGQGGNEDKSIKRNRNTANFVTHGYQRMLCLQRIGSPFFIKRSPAAIDTPKIYTSPLANSYVAPTFLEKKSNFGHCY